MREFYFHKELRGVVAYKKGDTHCDIIFVNYSMLETKRCKNCNSELAGLYCNQCGQKDTDLLSLVVIVREFTNNVFSFDSRFFITLKYLIIKPGFLTTEYWKGKRTTYLPPLRLYLVLSVLYFFIISMISDDTSVFSKISHEKE